MVDTPFLNVCNHGIVLTLMRALPRLSTFSCEGWGTRFFTVVANLFIFY
jgi:hypothetical protein